MHKWVCTLILFVLNQDYVPPKHNLTLTTDVVYLDYEWSWNLYLERYLTAMADLDFNKTVVQQRQTHFWKGLSLRVHLCKFDTFL